MKVVITTLALASTLLANAQSDSSASKITDRIYTNFTLGGHFNPTTNYYYGQNPTLGANLQAGVLYQAIPKLFAGIGLGVEKHDNLGMMPVFVDVRYKLKNKSSSLFLNVKTGYNYAFSSENSNRTYQGGIYTFVGFGHWVSLNKALALEVNFGFKHLSVNGREETRILPAGGIAPFPDYSYFNTYNRIEMRFGLLLK